MLQLKFMAQSYILSNLGITLTAWDYLNLQGYLR